MVSGGLSLIATPKIPLYSTVLNVLDNLLIYWSNSHGQRNRLLTQFTKSHGANQKATSLFSVTKYAIHCLERVQVYSKNTFTKKHTYMKVLKLNDA